MSDQDFLKELGYLAFTTRLKRISDAMLHDGRKLYKELALDIEPNWFIIFKLLKQCECLTVMEVADRIRMAHPSVINIVNKMTKAGYVESSRAADDSRKRVLKLTDKAKIRLPEYERIWEAGIAGVENAFKDLMPLNVLDQIEDKLAESGFKQRTLDELKKTLG